MPRKLVVTQYTSLDGVIEDPVGMEGSGLGNWTGPFSRGPAGDRFKHQELLDSSAVLLGRKTYDGFAAVWPTVKDEAGFADRLNRMPKFVASRTLANPAWHNTALLPGELVEGVRALKDGGAGDLLVYGSASLVHALLPAGLVDELRLMVYPTVLGRGTRWMPQGWCGSLELVECAQFNSGIVLLRYASTTRR